MIHLGDCLDVLPTIATGSVDMVFADLPYGVTENKWDAVIPFAPLWNELLRVGKKNCAFVFTATQPFATALINSQPRLFRYDLVWEKSRPTGFLNAKIMPLRKHESVLIFCKKKTTYNPQMTHGKIYGVGGTTGKGGTTYGKTRTPPTLPGAGLIRYPLSVFRVPVSDLTRGINKKGLVHPTQKPVALLEWLIKTYSNEGDTVLDPTMGSGTTGAACLNTGRQFIGIERDATYFATAAKRLGEAPQEAAPQPTPRPRFEQLAMW